VWAAEPVWKRCREKFPAPAGILTPIIQLSYPGSCGLYKGMQNAEVLPTPCLPTCDFTIAMASLMGCPSPGLLGCDAVQCCGNKSTFRRPTLPPSTRRRNPEDLCREYVESPHVLGSQSLSCIRKIKVKLSLTLTKYNVINTYSVLN
jgi:hypothetical protein